VGAHAGAPGWAVALEQSGYATAMRQWLWLYPATEIVHIIGIVLLVGAAAMFDLRLLGFSRGLPVRGMAWHLLPWAWVGLGLVLVSGLSMFTAHATEWVTSNVFRLKAALIVVAGLNAAVFHRRSYRTVDRWNTGAVARPAARVAAVISLVVWAAVITCGRLLAYF